MPPKTIVRSNQVEENELVTKNISHSGAVNFDIVRFNGTNFVPAQADSISNARYSGMIVNINGSSGDLVSQGYVDGLAGLTAGSLYYLSDSTAGAITTTQPSSIVKQVGIAISTTEFLVFNSLMVTLNEGTLTSNSTFAVPTQQSVKTYVDARTFAITTQTTNYSASSYQIVLMNNSAAATVTLPTAVANAQIEVKKVSSNNYVVTVATTGGALIDGKANLLIREKNTSRTFISDGTNWYIR